MSNVIRPTFGSRPRPSAEAAPVASQAAAELHPPYVYGRAAGYLVALMEDANGPEGDVLRVVVGPLAGNELEAVAVMPATHEGRTDADVTALAILRTLEIVEVEAGPASA
ncbi:hypothetical protein [Methylorubrum salsuginis]|uniref:Uncharacterized protein n=1 Tax=Methylorubrum salsuginis TaxID=414703 RepID=A0A1I4FNN3_9HYPH|nr:hypothetical protein [Methylorubrum salsuginis]SFL19049.1 hypothetical protein SAMN04488125_110120 [Methylorubrum salsuginis]